jgi:hypothetical protein
VLALTQKKREIEREPLEALNEVWSIRTEKIRAGEEPDREWPICEDGELAGRQRASRSWPTTPLEPLHQQELRRMRDLDEENRRRLAGAA